MAYVTPSAAAADFNLTGAEYIPPPAVSADFDLAAFGEQPIVYPPVPGVIASVGVGWDNGARRDSALVAVFRQAPERAIARSLGIRQAGTRPEPRIALRHQETEHRDQSRAIPWGPGQNRDEIYTEAAA